MPTSPLQFATNFAKMKSHLEALASNDARLMLLIDFWQEMQPQRDDPSYQSYFDEYIPLLSSSITDASIADLTIDELRKTRDVLALIGRVPSAGPMDRSEKPDILPRNKLELVTLHLAKLFFYVGAIEEGLDTLGVRGSLSRSFGAPSLAVGDSILGLENLNELAVLQAIVNHIIRDTPSPPTPLPQGEGQEFVGQDPRDPDKLTYSPLEKGPEGLSPTPTNVRKILDQILTDWQSERESAYHDRACCLFVEKDESGRATRGRMKTLVGNVELFGKSAPTDEITFDNQIKTPDDPFVGTGYNSLKAVRQIFKLTGLKNQASSFYHAHFHIEDSGQTFTGDSIGLALGLLTYTQLLRSEVQHFDRLLSGEVAFTGGVDTTGRLTPVNDETLPQKIERAFFSPVKYLVLPESNLRIARGHLETLRARYPRRHLILVGADRLGDVIDDHNVVRSEKVCIGKFTAKVVYKYTRMTKVQVPLLLVLGYLLLCLIYPKAWVGFDWNPAFARFNLQDNSLDFYNGTSQVVGSYPIKGKLEGENSALQAVADINRDGHNEILFIPPVSDDADERTMLFCCARNGDVLFKKSFVISDLFGDDTSGVLFDPEYVNTVASGGEVIIVTEVACRSSPARSHIRMWDSACNPVGEYINAGGSKLCWAEDIDSNGVAELFFLNYFDPVPCVSLLVLPLKGAFGASPPYFTDSRSIVRNLGGNELACILFPVTNIAREDIPSGYSQPSVTGLHHNSSQFLDVYVRESSGPAACVLYRVDRNFRVVDVHFTDELISRRNQLVSNKKIPGIDLGAFADSLRNSVKYWKGTSWVTEAQLRSR